ncbi:MAG: hypothetical protein QOI53_3275 [Verrucomicrobiota bacterium]|nr:hypothetical protein [Verrucomicrobiota bacterium]
MNGGQLALRGSEEIVSAYVCLDLTPKGRNETGPYFNLGDCVEDIAGCVFIEHALKPDISSSLTSRIL